MAVPTPIDLGRQRDTISELAVGCLPPFAFMTSPVADPHSMNVSSDAIERESMSANISVDN
jgi:hypothetical protein